MKCHQLRCASLSLQQSILRNPHWYSFPLSPRCWRFGGGENVIAKDMDQLRHVAFEKEIHIISPFSLILETTHREVLYVQRTADVC
jgi:hypothetical protein